MPPENRTEIVAVGKTAAATDLPDRITTAFQPEQQFRLLQPPSGQKFPEGSTARGAADCRTEVAAVNPEDLGEVGERGIQMVTSLDKILTLFEIVAVFTLFSPAGAGLLPERQLQQDELFQEPRRSPDLPLPFLAGNGK